MSTATTAASGPAPPSEYRDAVAAGSVVPWMLEHPCKPMPIPGETDLPHEGQNPGGEATLLGHTTTGVASSEVGDRNLWGETMVKQPAGNQGGSNA